MASLRKMHPIGHGMLLLASCSLLCASARPFSPAAHAQSARPAELVESLPKITPELLSLQQRLVEQLRLQRVGVEEQIGNGQRRSFEHEVGDLVSVSEDYFREL